MPDIRRDEMQTDILLKGRSIVEIEAEPIARIIHKACGAQARDAIKAANLIIDYLIEAYSNPARPQ